MENKPTKQHSALGQYALAMRIAVDLTVTIAVPALIAAYVGSKLDQNFGTKPWIMVILLGIALALTAEMIHRKAKHYAKLYKEGTDDTL